MTKRLSHFRLSKMGMTLEESARRMEALLNRKPQGGKLAAYLRSLPQRKRRAVVRPEDYAPTPFATAEDARRYADWEARGKPPSPSRQSKPDRKRPSAAMRAQARTLVEEIAEYQMGRCLLCGTTLDMETDFEPHDDRKPSIDHVTPRSLGGRHVGNRLVAHRKCNSDKSNRRPTGCELVWLYAVNARLGSPNP